MFSSTFLAAWPFPFGCYCFYYYFCLGFISYCGLDSSLVSSLATPLDSSFFSSNLASGFASVLPFFLSYYLASFFNWPFEGGCAFSFGNATKRFLVYTCSRIPGKCWIWSIHLKVCGNANFSRSYNLVKCSKRWARRVMSAAVIECPTTNILISKWWFNISASSYAVYLIAISIKLRI